MSVVRNFLTTDNISVIEEFIKNKTFLDELISYISNLIKNCQVEYDRELTDAEDEIKNIFIQEIKTIIKNLNMIICKYLAKKPEAMITLDLTSVWYSEKCIIPNDSNISNPYAQNKTISKILTIICKLIDFLNDYYINQINKMNQQIEYLGFKLKEQEHSISITEFNFMSRHFETLIRKIKVIKQNYITSLKDVHNISTPIHNYFINIFNMDFANTTYLQFTPTSILNIFRCALYFLTESNNFLEFIVKFKSWLPSDYRCKYGVEIIKLLNDKEIDYKNRQILKEFKPNPCLLIDDIITLYYKSNKNKSLLSDIVTLQYILGYFKEKINWIELGNERTILFMSIELSLISKFEKNEINNIEIYESILATLLELIINGLESSPSLFESYLVYLIPNKIISLYDENYQNSKIKINLDEIFRLYLSSKLGIYYLASIIEPDQMTKLILDSEQKAKFIKWYNYYKYINENVSDSDIIDPLTSSILVIPYVIPMDSDFNICNMCDKNIIESYLWEKKENPFTRGELTIEKLREFNILEKNVNLIKNTKSKLKQFITDAQKAGV
jgi:hypothetical protein